MKRLIAACVTVGLAVPIGIGVTVSLGAAADTDCWDEYNLSGSRFYGTLTPKDLPISDCTPADRCFTGYNRAGTKSRLFVPHGANPRNACAALSTTTTSTTTPSAPTGVTSGGRFGTLPPGSALPSDVECASRVRAMTENRPGNAAANATRGTKPDAFYPRVTGDFTGTTDEIIQWTACKWGIDEDLVRAQIVAESWWQQPTLGDFTTDPAMCAPGYPIGNYPPQSDGDSNHNGQCPESVGLGQVRWFYHQTAFADGNASKSSAYNLDYTYAVWRACYEGKLIWLNDVEGRGDYTAGDATGCQGVWFSGRWYTNAATDYIARLQDHLTQRTWEQSWFGPAYPKGTVIATGTGTTVPASTTTTSTTTPTTTTTSPTTTTTSPTTTTTSPTTTTTTTSTTLPATDMFVETFSDGEGWRQRFDTHVHFRADHDDPPTPVESTPWRADHGHDCGGPDTQRTVDASNRESFFFNCRDHLMTTMGDIDGYTTLAFSPKQTFPSVSRVCWDQNVTDLGGRQWTEVVVTPANLIPGNEIAHVNPDFESVDNTATHHGPGTVGIKIMQDYDGFRAYVSRRQRAFEPWTSFDAEGFESRAIRRQHCITDNGNGTITMSVDRGVSGLWTKSFAGSLPDNARVVFEDHNYTPDKDGEACRTQGTLSGCRYTWHWDNIVIQ